MLSNFFYSHHNKARKTNLLTHNLKILKTQFQIISFLCGPTSEEKSLRNEISNLRQELKKLSMKDDYTAYVKLERKIVSTEVLLNEKIAAKGQTNMFIKYGLSYGSQAFLTLVLVIVSIYCRGEPVIVLGDKFDLTPFGVIMKFPTGVQGAISVPFWIFVSSFVSRTIAGYVK